VKKKASRIFLQKSGKGNKNKGFFLETNQRGLFLGGNEGALMGEGGHFGARYPGYCG